MPPIAMVSVYFNPLPRKEGDFPVLLALLTVSDFNPLPRKEGDPDFRRVRHDFVYFNPLPRKEGDNGRYYHSDRCQRFQSTPS